MKQKTLQKYGIPVIEGSEGGVSSLEMGKKYCKKNWLSYFNKSCWGGGKGMKIVKSEKEFDDLFLTQNQRQRNFLQMMKFILKSFLKIQDI